MPARILSMLSQPIVLSASTPVGSVVDAYATRTVSLAAGTYRIFLAPSGGTGTESSPWELLSALKTACDAATSGANPYAWSLTASGFVQLVYTGSGTTSITWDAGHVLRNVLGFTGNLSSVLTSTASYHPTHCAYSEGREQDSDWIVQAGKQPAGITRGGRTFARSDGARRLIRKLRFAPLPLYWEHRASVAGLGVECTPAMPDDLSRALLPSAAAGGAPPWSWCDLVQSSPGKRLGAALGTYQELLDTPGDYDACYLHPETVSSDSTQGLSTDEFRLARWQDVTLSFVARESQ